jgi:6,7-dimethyl-8-ribityllumazine synthase
MPIPFLPSAPEPAKDGFMKILIVIADFYKDIADMLQEGAISALNVAGAGYDVVAVPGALEIPPAISMAASSGLYDGYVALGCVIRGETSHYDTVCNESARGLMDLGIHDLLAIGNGILTVESHAQAVVRADKMQKNKGAGAVEACLRLVALSHQYIAAE